MKLLKDLKRAAEILAQHPECWAICGGVAAAIYRTTPRYTADLDIALVDSPGGSAAEAASALVAALGYKPISGWVTDQHGVLIRSQALVVGREDHCGGYVGIDLLLPVLPWIPEAVRRAQVNKLDFGFARLPTIPPEDLVIAKLFALAGSPDRPNDLDDIVAVLHGTAAIDRDYLKERIAQYNLPLPDAAQKALDKVARAGPETI